MVKLLKYFLSILAILVVLSCGVDSETKATSNRAEAEKIYKEAIQFYQGTAIFQNGVIDAFTVDSTYDEAIRELSIAYLKRGYPHEWKKRIDIAVELNPEIWQGYRGYNYLWFYRDYERAIADFDATDTLTPNFKDAPQGHSVDYWRGIAYLGLNNHERSISYFDEYITSEVEEFGEDWVEVTAFLYRGIAYYEIGNFEEALSNFDKQLKYSRGRSADAKYYKALIFKSQNKTEEAKSLLDGALDDYNIGYYNNRPYVETLRQIYPEDIEVLKASL